MLRILGQFFRIYIELPTLLIKKIINAYYYYLARKIDQEKLKQLITFFNSVVIEIYEQDRISVEAIDEEITSLLINFYKENDGDITLMLEVIPLSRNEDVERFIKIYENLIKEKK